jgi:hypothetical protein
MLNFHAMQKYELDCWQGHPEQSGALCLTALWQKWHSTMVPGAKQNGKRERASKKLTLQ